MGGSTKPGPPAALPAYRGVPGERQKLFAGAGGCCRVGDEL